MKMEVLSVQNQFQGQFSVISSTKVKDWTSPLTPPPQPSSTTGAHDQRNSQNHHRPQQHHQEQKQHRQLQRSSSNGSTNSSNTPSADVVDGRQPQQQQRKQQHFYHNNQQHHQQYYNQYHQQQQQLNQVAAAMEATAAMESTNGTGNASNANSRYSYNNNLLCYGASAATPEFTVSTPCFCIQNDTDAAAVAELSQLVQAKLRAAKSQHLACTEVSLPYDLTPRIAREIYKMSEREPCGVRGCSIFIEFEDEPNNIRRIASFKVDPDTVSTFELYLTLKQDKSGWTSLLPQFIKNLTRSSTILISPDFTLTKNKLYSCE